MQISDDKLTFLKSCVMTVVVLATFLAMGPLPVQARVNVAVGQLCGASDESQQCGPESSTAASCQRVGDVIACRNNPCGTGDSCPEGYECRDIDEARGAYRGCVAASAAAVGEGAVITGEEPAPTLSIPIPTISLSNMVVTTRGVTKRVDIPWIADYVSGAYRYAVFVASILAAVMMMIGGIQWLTAGGNAEHVGKAKARIVNATVGLILTLGTYLLLFTINPDLIRLNSLNIPTTTPINFANEGNVSVGQENPSSATSASGGQYEEMANRIAEEFGFNGCLFSRQIGMESRWNTRSSTGCCYGLGQVHWNNARAVLNNATSRERLIEAHSQGCPRCPAADSTKEVIGAWLMDDPESNLIISAMIRRDSLRSAPNPLAAAGIYGMGLGSYNNYIRTTGCQARRFNENQLMELISSGTSIDSLIDQSCIPPGTWPLAREGLNCPGGNPPCCSRTAANCEQPAYNRSLGRIGVCIGGTRNGERCAAIAGGEPYIRSYGRIVAACARE